MGFLLGATMLSPQNPVKTANLILSLTEGEGRMRVDGPATLVEELLTN
jgi:hypothetical protein